MNPEQLLIYIIPPALLALGDKFNSYRAHIQLLATCGHESHCGEFVHEEHDKKRGAALGIYQCEPTTHRLVLHWTMKHEPTVLVSLTSSDDRLMYDLNYATQIARLLYYSIPEPLPAVDMTAMWHYYKSYYNRGGAATQNEWDANWKRFIAPVLSPEVKL